MAAPLPLGSQLSSLPQAPAVDPRMFVLDAQGALASVQAGLLVGKEIANLQNQKARLELEKAEIAAKKAANERDRKQAEHAIDALPLWQEAFNEDLRAKTAQNKALISQNQLAGETSVFLRDRGGVAKLGETTLAEAAAKKGQAELATRLADVKIGALSDAGKAPVAGADGFVPKSTIKPGLLHGETPVNVFTRTESDGRMYRIEDWPRVGGSGIDRTREEVAGPTAAKELRTAEKDATIRANREMTPIATARETVAAFRAFLRDPESNIASGAAFGASKFNTLRTTMNGAVLKAIASNEAERKHYEGLLPDKLDAIHVGKSPDVLLGRLDRIDALLNAKVDAVEKSAQAEIEAVRGAVAPVAAPAGTSLTTERNQRLEAVKSAPNGTTGTVGKGPLRRRVIKFSDGWRYLPTK